MTETSPRAPTAQTLAIQRIALGMGPILFGLVIWYVQRQPGWNPARAAAPLSYGVLVLCVAAIAGAFMIRNQLARITDIKQRAVKLIMAWALGESAAIFGGITYYLSGEAQWYLVGLLSMVAVFMLVPIKPE